MLTQRDVVISKIIFSCLTFQKLVSRGQQTTMNNNNQTYEILYEDSFPAEPTNQQFISSLCIRLSISLG